MTYNELTIAILEASPNYVECKVSMHSYESGISNKFTVFITDYYPHMRRFRATNRDTWAYAIPVIPVRKVPLKLPNLQL